MPKVILLHNRVGRSRGTPQYLECPCCRQQFRKRWTDQQFCSPECFRETRKNPRPSQSEVLYQLASHEFSRKKLGRYYGVSAQVTYKWLPAQEVSKLQRGDMVSIGGILAKRCSGCGVTWQLDRFWARANAASGCYHLCDNCRPSRRKR